MGGVKVNDTMLWVEDTAESDLPAILCLHSLFLDSRMYDELTAAAAGRYRIVRPDFRGQGKSGCAGTARIDMDTCAADMAALLDTLGLDAVNVVMQSMGGDVGLRLVANDPPRFRSMVILGSSANALEGEQLEHERQWINGAGTRGFVDDILQTTMEVMFGSTTRNDPSKREFIDLWQERIAALPLGLFPAMSGVIERGDIRELLPQIPVSALIFSGHEDIARPPQWHREMADALPNARLMHLPSVGHSPILEDPERVIPAILAFIEDPISRTQ